MALYDTRARCPYCRKYDLPCNDAVHGNPLFPYLGAVGNAVPVIPGYAEPAVRMATPPPAKVNRARLRDWATSLVLIFVLIAAIAAIAASAVAVLGTGSDRCDLPPCAPVEYATIQSPPPTPLTGAQP